LVLFGGTGNATTTGADTWEWTGTTWTQLSPATSPSTRGYGAFGFDTAMTITGTGFAAGARISGPKGVTFSSVVVDHSTTITATMKVAATTATGTKLKVTVTNDASAGYGKASKGVLKIT
jgi:hypothetical protein